MLLPQFPKHQQPIELHTLMNAAISLGIVKSSWNNVDRSLPWQAHTWRSIPSGVANAYRDGRQFQQYIEINEYGLIYSAFVIGIGTMPLESDAFARFIPAYAILAYLDITLRFANRIYETTKYRIPLKLNAQLVRANGPRLNFLRPNQANHLRLNYLGTECPDEVIIMLDTEVQSFDLATQHNELMIAATSNIFWAFGIIMEPEELRKWYEALSK